MAVWSLTVLLVTPAAGAQRPDAAVRSAVRALAGAGDVASLKQALEGLPAAIQAKVKGETVRAEDLKIPEIVKILGGVQAEAAKGLGERAATTCGSLVQGKQASLAEYLRRVGDCLLGVAKELAPGAGDDAIQAAVRRVAEAGRGSGQNLLAVLQIERRKLAQRLNEADLAALFPAAIAQAATRAQRRPLTAFSAQAIGCALARNEGEETPAYASRIGKCLASATEAGRARRQVGALRKSIRELAAQAVRGARTLKAALGRLQLPEGLALPPDLRKRLIEGSDATARSFAQTARTCADLPESEDLAKRVLDCLVGAGDTSFAAVTPVVQELIEGLITMAQRGRSAISKGLEGAIRKIPRAVSATGLLPEELRANLLQADNRELDVFIRGARRCQKKVRSINQRPADFVVEIGLCLTKALARTDPLEVVKIISKSIHHLTDAAKKGGAAARKALPQAEKLLGGRVSVGAIYGRDLRWGAMKGDDKWAKKFVALAVPVCSDRQFKKGHNLPEHIRRVAMCLSTAARGIGAEEIEKEARSSVRSIVEAAAKGQRAVRVVVEREVRELERIMQVKDLLEPVVQKMLIRMRDTQAKAFAHSAASCHLIPRSSVATLGKLMKAMQECILSARKATTRDQLAQRVRDAVQVLAGAAREGAVSLRGAVERASGQLRGLVDAKLLFTPALRRLIRDANDEVATSFAGEADTCAKMKVEERDRRSTSRYVGRLARCLVASKTKLDDKAREEGVKGAVEELAELAGQGADDLRKGFAALLDKHRKHLPLRANLIQGLDFTERTAAVAAGLRGTCAKLVGTTERDVKKAKDCVYKVVAAALKIPPPDPCRGKAAGTDLFECCLTANNRTFPSCVSHRTACRPGFQWNHTAGACQQIVCPPGTAQDASGQCVQTAVACAPGMPGCMPGQGVMPGPAYTRPGMPGATVCPAGQFLNNLGQCQMASCAAGMQLDNLNRCIRRLCPQGTIAQGMNCVSMGCPQGLVRNTLGQCQPATCPDSDMYLSRSGACVEMSCPEGLIQQGRRCVRGFNCPAGFVLTVTGQCTTTVCPPGMIPTGTGQCIPHMVR